MRGNPVVALAFGQHIGSIPACAGEPVAYLRYPGGPAVYPRVCGGTFHPRQRAQLHAGAGLSPRVRGNPGEVGGHQILAGSIPACAGEPPPSAPGLTLCRALSPRVRGNPRSAHSRSHSAGSIPACAGEPSSARPTSCSIPVYPRVCGGTSCGLPLWSGEGGLSPRVRGNHKDDRHAQPHLGSIPACAGEPSTTPPFGIPARVYPRVCGGTLRILLGVLRTIGLSPRVRGNRLRQNGGGVRKGSIPACAREPRRTSRRQSPGQVYPRVCGGTARLWAAGRAVDGLSPRVRGNRVGRHPGRARPRSIPACAGEPRAPTSRICSVSVYPRVCGGTRRQRQIARSGQGLSPRVRGNPLESTVCGEGKRSIPACAGEPVGSMMTRRRVSVYPRVCGGTGGKPGEPDEGMGLSPRVRGNLPGKHP